MGLQSGLKCSGGGGGIGVPNSIISNSRHTKNRRAHQTKQQETKGNGVCKTKMCARQTENGFQFLSVGMIRSYSFVFALILRATVQHRNNDGNYVVGKDLFSSLFPSVYLRVGFRRSGTTPLSRVVWAALSCAVRSANLCDVSAEICAGFSRPNSVREWHTFRK